MRRCMNWQHVSADGRLSLWEPFDRVQPRTWHTSICRPTIPKCRTYQHIEIEPQIINTHMNELEHIETVAVAVTVKTFEYLVPVNVTAILIYNSFHSMTRVNVLVLNSTYFIAHCHCTVSFSFSLTPRVYSTECS